MPDIGAGRGGLEVAATLLRAFLVGDPTMDNQFKQLIRDSRTGEYVQCDGSWTRRRAAALNCQSAAQLVKFRLEHIERSLEVLLQRPGRPDQVIPL